MRDRLSAWANNDSLEARDLQEAYRAQDVYAIAEAPDREKVRLRGILKTVTLRPRGGVPALEAELFDGTGVVTVVWLGRRRIAGIVPGRSIQVAGRIGAYDGARVLYNPRYELIP
ncbi:OB-fold nucleic acid binding domain-containing protein [Nocardioides sp.]|uniref:OB-fold nucleic acid binding domain-containing protein n=1 Tax=Nocardioides sp. TaxID=35761 RepID=UPI00260CB088|nr:OB-fold nucleic acid binding domain-containing protein [Nocardioides sp.]